MSPRPFRTLRARWLFPIDQPPLRDGVVEIHGDEIIAVRAYRPGEQTEDLGDVALLPGLVNAHTHLEFSKIAEPLGKPLMAFPDWIRLVIEHRRCEMERDISWRSDAVSLGLSESQAAGIALLGEIATYDVGGRSTYESTDSFTKQLVFAELLGLAPDRVEPQWQAALAHLAACDSPGLSPHAPYTVHPDLLARVCRLSAEQGFPIAMHIAESLEEIELLASGSGRLVELLNSLRAFPRDVISRGTRPLDYLRSLSQAARALVIHGNYLSPEEITFVGERSATMSIVYCPRTHAYFNAGPYPLTEMLAANVNVCLGTDSRASNPDLSLFEELRFIAQRHSNVTLEGVLYLGTQAGAEALGRGDRFGSLSPGKSARLTQVQLSMVDAADPHELLFAEGTRPTALV